MPDENIVDVVKDLRNAADAGEARDLHHIVDRLEDANGRKDAALLALADDVMSPTVRFLPTLIAARIREIAGGS